MALQYIGPMCIISNGGIDALYCQPMSLFEQSKPSVGLPSAPIGSSMLDTEHEVQQFLKLVLTL